MEEKEVLLSALNSTARNITEEFATLREGEGEGEGGETRAEVGKKVFTCTCMYMYMNIFGGDTCLSER